MSRIAVGGQVLKVTDINYQDSKQLRDQSRRSSRKSKSTHTIRNPIKVVMDMIGEDGSMHQKIVNQPPPNFTYTAKMPHYPSRSVPKLQKYEMTPMMVKNLQSTQPRGLARSFVFNRFNYDNCRQFPIPKTRNSMPSKKVRVGSGHKNLEIVYCENKLGDFVHKTNQQIQQLYRKQQERQSTIRKKIMQESLSTHRENNSKNILTTRRQVKTSLATCLKQYATLEKLSMFMESDQRRRQYCLGYEMERDPSRTLLLDIITHRFGFLKKMPKRLRDQLYRSILGRQANSLTKINIQEYMKISAMFVGRDASAQQKAVFSYEFIFGGKEPSFDTARERLELLNGHAHRLKALLEQLFVLVMETQNTEFMIQVMAKNQSLLQLILDYIVERE